MFKKLKIVLLNPRFIGLYIEENIFSLFFKLFLVMLIALSPTYITIFYQSQISSEFRSYLVDTVATASIEDTYIEDYQLYTENEYSLYCAYFYVNIGGEMDLDSTVSSTNTLFFNETMVEFYLGNVLVYSVSYETLNLETLNFEDIAKTNLVETSKFISVFNYLYINNHTEISLLFCLANTIKFGFLIFCLPILLVMTSYMRNKTNLMPFVCRYKMCLNAQYIYLLIFLVGSLLGIDFIAYVGTFVMSIYAFKALNTITLEKRG